MPHTCKRRETLLTPEPKAILHTGERKEILHDSECSYMKERNQRTKLVGTTIILAALFAGFYLAGILIPNGAVNGDFLNAKQAPSWMHPFGTDALGRDLLMRTMKGMAVSISIGLGASAVSAVIALFIGAAAAAGSRRVDQLINWIIDLVMSVPHIVLMLLISFVAGKGAKGLFIGIAAVHWCSLARLIRGEVMQLRTRPYVLISRKLGKSGGWILRHHLLPHLVPQFITGLILMFPHAILHEASVSFLGYGLPPEQPSIGIILSESMRYLSAGMWWPAVLPGITLVLQVFLIDRVGENLRIILDPASAQM